jgi:hypothetical protein
MSVAQGKGKAPRITHSSRRRGVDPEACSLKEFDAPVAQGIIKPFVCQSGLSEINEPESGALRSPKTSRLPQDKRRIRKKHKNLALLEEN